MNKKENKNENKFDIFENLTKVIKNLSDEDRILIENGYYSKDIISTRNGYCCKYRLNIMLKRIFCTFGLSIKDYEHIFKVKRATIYNWKKGIELLEHQFEKITELHKIYYKIAPYMNHRVGRLGKTHKFKNTTLLQKLSLDLIDNDSVIEHFKILNIILESREQEFMRIKRLEMLNDIDTITGSCILI